MAAHLYRRLLSRSLPYQCKKRKKKYIPQIKITLSYKRGAKKTTTRLPVIDVSADQANLFSNGTVFEVLIEAHDEKNNVVGEVKLGGMVNPATRSLSIKHGQTIPVTLRMDLEFEGKFTVKALDPVTLTTYSKLDLETDYTV